MHDTPPDIDPHDNQPEPDFSLSMAAAAAFGPDRNWDDELQSLPADYIENRETIEAWIKDNIELVPYSTWAGVLEEDFRNEQELARDGSIVAGVLALHRVVWEKFGLLATLGSFQFGRPRSEPEQWLLEACGLIDARIVVKRRPPPIAVANAFLARGVADLGQVSASQISEGLFTALIAPPEAWTTTDRGFPRYNFDYNGITVGYIVRPDIIARHTLAEDIEQMQRLLEGHSIADWDVAFMLMNQTFADEQDDGTAYIAARHMLDYRGLPRKRGKDGHSAGHQQKSLASVALSMRLLSHIWVDPGGMPMRSADPYTLNHKMLTILDDIEQRDGGETQTLAWHYSLGDWFKTFREKPNRYIALQWRHLLRYDSLHDRWVKQLAYYLSMELRKNARHGMELRRSVDTLLRGAQIPVDERFPMRARDRLEGAIRTIVGDKLFQVHHANAWLSGSSPELDAWTAGDGLPARTWFGTYRRRVITFRADAVIEGIYANEIRGLAPGRQTE